MAIKSYLGKTFEEVSRPPSPLVSEGLSVLLFRLMVEKLRILFGPHCNISAYIRDFELKLAYKCILVLGFQSEMEFSI